MRDPRVVQIGRGRAAIAVVLITVATSCGGSDDVEAHATKNTLTGAFHRFDTFQLRSAGADGVLDTDDDIANFEVDVETFPGTDGR